MTALSWGRSVIVDATQGNSTGSIKLPWIPVESCIPAKLTRGSAYRSLPCKTSRASMSGKGFTRDDFPSLTAERIPRSKSAGDLQDLLPPPCLRVFQPLQQLRRKIE